MKLNDAQLQNLRDAVLRDDTLDDEDLYRLTHALDNVTSDHELPDGDLPENEGDDTLVDTVARAYDFYFG